MWIDVARGIGIILVVYGHALRGLVNASILPNSGWPALHNQLIYAFHMPLFFLLAGLTIERALKAGRRHFLEDKLAVVVWPYFLWSLIHGGVKLMAGAYVNDPMTARDLLLIPVQPIEHFWFLYCLFFCQVIVAMLASRKIALAFTAVLGGAMWFAGVGGGTIISAILYNLAFVAAGVFAMPYLWGKVDGRAIAWSFVIGGWVGFGAVFLLAKRSELAAYPLALLGTVGTIGVAMLFRDGVLGKLLAFLGRLSMPIYLIHTIASAGVRAIFQRIGVDATILLLIVTLAGIVLPVACYHIAARLNLTRVLGLGGPSKNQRQAIPSAAATG